MAEHLTLNQRVTGSIPVRSTRKFNPDFGRVLCYLRSILKAARVAKLANAPDLGSGAFGLRGSSPLLRTNIFSQSNLELVNPPPMQGVFVILKRCPSLEFAQVGQMQHYHYGVLQIGKTPFLEYSIFKRRQ